MEIWGTDNRLAGTRRFKRWGTFLGAFLVACSVLFCPVQWLFSGSFGGRWLPLAMGDAAGSSTYGVYRPAARHRGGTSQ